MYNVYEIQLKVIFIFLSLDTNLKINTGHFVGLFIGCVQLWVFSATFDNLGGGQFCLWMKLEYHNRKKNTVASR
jgi:hypothetical protein